MPLASGSGGIYVVVFIFSVKQYREKLGVQGKYREFYLYLIVPTL